MRGGLGGCGREPTSAPLSAGTGKAPITEQFAAPYVQFALASHPMATLPHCPDGGTAWAMERIASQTLPILPRESMSHNGRVSNLRAALRNGELFPIALLNQPAIDSSNIVDFATLGRAEPRASALDGTPRLQHTRPIITSHM